jgi:hypothetical protein
MINIKEVLLLYLIYKIQDNIIKQLLDNLVILHLVGEVDINKYHLNLEMVIIILMLKD